MSRKLCLHVRNFRSYKRDDIVKTINELTMKVIPIGITKDSLGHVCTRPMKPEKIARIASAIHAK